MIMGLIMFVSLGVAVEKYAGPPEIKEIPLQDISLEQQEEVWKELELLDTNT